MRHGKQGTNPKETFSLSKRSFCFWSRAELTINFKHSLFCMIPAVDQLIVCNTREFPPVRFAYISKNQGEGQVPIVVHLSSSVKNKFFIIWFHPSNSFLTTKVQFSIKRGLRKSFLCTHWKIEILKQIKVTRKDSHTKYFGFFNESFRDFAQNCKILILGRINKKKLIEFSIKYGVGGWVRRGSFSIKKK